MKKTINAILLFSGLLVSGFAQQTKGPKLIVRGDDMGATHSINKAMLFCAENGIQTSIEVMVSCPWFPEAVRMLKEIPGYDTGIHLTLNSEWDLYKPRPITDCSSIKDSDGYFYPYVNPDQKFPGESIMEHDWKLDDIEKEFGAQIELGLKYLPNVTHISGHMGVTGFDKKVKELTHRLAHEYHLADIGSDPLESYNLVKVTYIGPHKTLNEKIISFIKMLDSLKPGKIYFFVDHPAYDTDEMKPISYKGVADVAEHRQGVTDMFCNEKVKAEIAKRGIQLVSYGEVAKPR